MITSTEEAELKTLKNHLKFKTLHRYRPFSLIYQKSLPYQILGGKTEKIVQIDLQKNGDMVDIAKRVIVSE